MPAKQTFPPVPDIPARRWRGPAPPRRVLAIRLQATGDVVGALPYLRSLRNVLPETARLDLLTREETADIPRNILLFDRVHAIGGGRSRKLQLASVAMMLPRLLWRRYDVVLDLQNNLVSRIVRRALNPAAWCEYDRFSPISGSERYRLAIEKTGMGGVTPHDDLPLKMPTKGREILLEHGWDGREALVVLNPAAAFETRNWAIDNYVTFARLWLEVFPHSRFLVLGTSFIAEKAAFLGEQLGKRLINLVGLTTPAEALAVLQSVELVLSEDSGLMHMAWCSGVTTLGLFGGTRTDWVRLQGDHTFFLDASDLPCGGCMQAVCRFGDVHCMTRIAPREVFGHACALVDKVRRLNEPHVANASLP